MKQPLTINEKIILCSKWLFVALILLFGTVYTQEWLQSNSKFFDVMIGFIGLINFILLLIIVLLLIYSHFPLLKLYFKYLENKKNQFSKIDFSIIFLTCSIILCVYKVYDAIVSGKIHKISHRTYTFIPNTYKYYYYSEEPVGYLITLGILIFGIISSCFVIIILKKYLKNKNL